jgi:hypothetical protein
MARANEASAALKKARGPHEMIRLFPRSTRSTSTCYDDVQKPRFFVLCLGCIAAQRLLDFARGGETKPLVGIVAGRRLSPFQRSRRGETARCVLRESAGRWRCCVASGRNSAFCCAEINAHKYNARPSLLYLFFLPLVLPVLFSAIATAF